MFLLYFNFSSMSRRELAEIFEDTYKLSKTKFPYANQYENFPLNSSYDLKTNKKLKELPELEVTVNDCMDDCFQILLDTKYIEKTTAPDVVVEESDEIDELDDEDELDETKTETETETKEEFKVNPELKPKILLINCGSLLNQGGGVVKGASAQEEAICRRSNLFLALDGVEKDIEYPLFGKTKGIYTPNVTFFKDANYELLQNPFAVDVLTLFSRPANKIKSDEEFDELYRNIFETLVYVCNKNNIEYVIFSPIGCGAFKNDPNDVAEKLMFYLNIYKIKTVKKFIVSCFDHGNNFEAFSYFCSKK